MFAAAIVSALPIRTLLVGNSDTLMPAAFAHNLLNDPGTIASFQFSRLPSFFPDLVVYVGLSALVPSWQAATFAYAVLAYVALVVVGGAVVGLVSGRGWRWGAAAFLVASALALLWETAARGGRGALLYVFVPVNHAGSMTLSLVGLLLGAWLLAGRPRWGFAALFLVSALGALSDKLFVGSCLVPLVAGTAAWLWRGGLGRRRAAGVIAAAGLGCAVGIALDHVIFADGLVRQPDIPINLHHQRLMLAALLQDSSVALSVAAAVVVAALPLLWVRRDAGLAFWWAAGTATAAGFLGLLPLLYADLSATRYVQPVWWWLVIVVASGALRAAPRLMLGASAALVLASLVTQVGEGRTLLRPGLVLAARSPVASCLVPLHEAGVIHAGIAGYWDAREIEASSNWRLQLEQVSTNAQIFIWGNNSTYYTHDRFDPARKPLFDYVVVRDLTPNTVLARFGKPDRVIPCPGADVWTYALPGGIGPMIGKIGMADERNEVMNRGACFGPRDFATGTGVLWPEGLTVPLTAPGQAFAAWGPYVAIRAGSWRLRLLYRLTEAGTGPRDWDVVIEDGTKILGIGPLPAEGTAQRVQDVTVTARQDTTSLEIRLKLQPGDHLEIDSLTIWPASGEEPRCGTAGQAASKP